MFSTFLAWLAGGGIAAIGKELNRAYEAKLNAKNDSERIEADKQIAQLQARQAVLIAEQGSWLTRWIRPALAFPVVFIMGKLFIWDKALGLGTTDGLSDNMWTYIWIVVGFYFLTRPFEKRRF